MSQLSPDWSWYSGSSKCTVMSFRNDAEKLKNKCAVSIIAGFFSEAFPLLLEYFIWQPRHAFVWSTLSTAETIPSNFSNLSSLLFQVLASDGVQQSIPVPVTITVLDANDNTPTFANLSYSVNLFTDIIPGETVIEVHICLEIFGLTLHFVML